MNNHQTFWENCTLLLAYNTYDQKLEKHSLFLSEVIMGYTNDLAHYNP